EVAPAAPSAAPQARNPTVLAMLLLISLGLLAYTGSRVSKVQGELERVREQQQVTQELNDSEAARRLSTARLEHARELFDLGESERALRLTQSVIDSAPNPNAAHLSKAFRFRAVLRRKLEKPGAQADDARAQQLEAQKK
ncbi:MAG: hypothetical protein JKY65_06385, partial [Planctomycetes bacterium]|nr:hypothetical protein [Planctomycetota bacterium]